jgi:hypothetical protein
VRLRCSNGEELIRSEFIYAPVNQGGREIILILGGIDQNFHLSNKIIELDFQKETNPMKNSVLSNL